MIVRRLDLVFNSFGKRVAVTLERGSALPYNVATPPISWTHYLPVDRIEKEFLLLSRISLIQILIGDIKINNLLLFIL